MRPLFPRSPWIALACAAALVTHLPAAATVTGELQGHWALDETNAADLQVYNTAPVADPEHGLRTATMEIGRVAPVGTGYLFDGLTNNDYVELGSSFVQELRGTNELSISGWINPAFLRAGSNAGSRQTILAANSNLQFSLQNEGHFVYVYTRDGEFVTIGLNEAQPVTPGEFVHVALTHAHDPDGFGDDVVSLYLNGQLVEQVYPFPTLAAYEIGGESLYLGRYEGNTSRDFDGLMSDIGLWIGRSLSHAEVAAIGGLGRADVALSSPQVDAVLAMFESGSGTVQTGAWEWSYTTSFATPTNGSALSLGKHYYGVDDNIYVVLGGTEGNWRGVTASGGTPFEVPFSIVEEPEDQEVEIGETATFEVAVQGAGEVAFQWYVTIGTESYPIEGATGAQLAIAAVELADEGFYACEISAADGNYRLRTREARLTIVNKPARLVGHWKLDETDPESLTVFNSAPDAVEHGTRVPSIEIGQPSIVGRAYHLAGETSNHYVQLGSSYISDLTGTNTATISAWLKPETVRAGGGSSSRHVVLAANVQFQLALQNQGRVLFHFRDSENTIVDFLQGTELDDRVAAGEWNHVAVVRSGANASIYINGVEVAVTDSLPTDPFTMTADMLQLGRESNRTDRQFDGFISDVGLWTGIALTHNEVALTGAIGRAGRPLSSGDEIASLRALFDGKSGSFATGNWEWSYAASVPNSDDGLGLRLGKHFETGGRIYVVLGGEEGAWEGLVAEPGEAVGFDAWAQSHFSPAELADPDISGPDAMPAGDGVPNLLKYAFGLEPKTTAPRDELPVMERSGDDLVFVFTRVKNIGDVTYGIEVSEDLVEWVPATGWVEEILEDRGETERVLVRISGVSEEDPRAFFKLNVQLIGN